MQKKLYVAPEIKTVEFKVEAGFNNSIQARNGEGLLSLDGYNQTQNQQHFGRMTQGNDWGTFN